MENKENLYNNTKDNIIVLILLTEYILFPKFAVIGPLKICHLFMMYWFINHMINAKKQKLSNIVEEIIRRVYLLIIIAILGEITFFIYSNITENYKIIDFMVLYLNMICAVGIGYSHYRFDKKILLYFLYLNIFLNIMVTLIGANQPSFFRLFWSSYREAGVRNHGIVGNANSSMAIMNVVLLSIVILYYKSKIVLKEIDLILLIFLPIGCDILINSRGEFLCTILLSCTIIYAFFNKNHYMHSVKFFKILTLITIIFLSIYLFFSQYVIQAFPRIQNSIERLQTLEKIFDTTEEYTYRNRSETIMRPLYAFDKFFPRFIKSPIWGSGFEIGDDEVFGHRVGYHNDFYAILVSTGILGFLIEIGFIKNIIKCCGWPMIFPLVITALSNTFLYANACVTIYFFIWGFMIRYNSDEIDNINE